VINILPRINDNAIISPEHDHLTSQNGLVVYAQISLSDHFSVLRSVTQLKRECLGNKSLKLLTRWKTASGFHCVTSLTHTLCGKKSSKYFVELELVTRCQ